jgi:hypothetical protein
MDRYSILLKKKPPAPSPKIESEWDSYLSLLLQADRMVFKEVYGRTAINNLTALRDLERLLVKANSIDPGSDVKAWPSPDFGILNVVHPVYWWTTEHPSDLIYGSIKAVRIMAIDNIRMKICKIEKEVIDFIQGIY